MTEKQNGQQEMTSGTNSDDSPDTKPYTYDAFISYRHVHPDIEIAKALHTALETYRIPKQIAASRGSKRLAKIFRDQEELPVSEDLSRDILHALQSSRYLIVVCSPQTPQSLWCSKEIELFKKTHGHSRILSLLIAGEPAESFPAALYSQSTLPFPLPNGIVSEETEPLAADIRAPRLRAMLRKLKNHEILRLVAPILGVSFDSLRQRERERNTRKKVRFAMAGMILATAFGLLLGVGLNRIEAEQQRTILEAQKVEIERARADKLLADSQLADVVASAALAEQTQKAEIEKQRADLEMQKTLSERQRADLETQKALSEKQRADLEEQKALSESQRADLEAQKAETERFRAEEQQKKASTLATSAMLSDLLVDAQNDLSSGSRSSAMKKAARILQEYASDWGGYALVKRMSELVLQKAAYEPSFSLTRIITSSPNAQNRTFRMHITKDGTRLYCNTVDDASIECWDIKTGHLLARYEIGERLSSMLVDEENGLILCVGTAQKNIIILELQTGIIKKTLSAPPKYSHYFENRALLQKLSHPISPNEYRYVVNKDGRKAFQVAFTATSESLSITEIDAESASGSDACVFPVSGQAGLSADFTCTLKTTGTTREITVQDKTHHTIRTVNLESYQYVESAAVTTDGKWLIVTSTDYLSDSTIYVYSMKPEDKAPLTYMHQDSACLLVGVAEDQSTLVVAGEYDVRLMDLTSGYIRTIPFHGREVDGCLLSPDGTSLLVSADNQIHVYTCPSQLVFPAPFTATEVLDHVQYETCVGSSSLDQYHAYTADGDISANVGLLNRTYIDITSATNKEIASHYRSDGDISCFGLDGHLHRLYVYSWEEKKIHVWDYEKNKLLENLTTPYDLGAVSIQPGRVKNTVYMANGFVLNLVDLNTHTVLKSYPLEEEDRNHLLSITYLIDETNDRVFTFSGDERNSQTLQTVYGIYQLSTGMKIRSDIMENSPLHNQIFLLYGLWEEAGVVLFNFDNKDQPYPLGYVELPSISRLREAAAQP